MIKDYNQTLPGLEQDTISKIQSIRKHRIFMRQTGYGLLSLGSFAGIIASGIYVKDILLTSGSFEYFSLLFSDVKTLAYWKELSLSMAESLPFLGLAMLCGIGALFLWSAMRTTQLQLFKKALI
ncbi:MAG: hypothetical protein AAB610_02155 [Patescibacteria group bacterium]